MLKNLIFTVLFSLVSPLLKAEVIDVIYDGESDKKTRSNAKKEIFQKAIDETSKQYIKQMIGEVKYNRNLSLIQNRIIKNSGKYIPYTKGSKLEYDTEKKMNLMSVTMKFSLQNLKKLLLKKGLLYKSDNTPKILPLIKIVDHVKFSKNTWWTQTQKQSGFYHDLVDLTHKNLSEVFIEKDFYTLSPIKSNSYLRVPKVLKNTNLRKEESLLLGEYFNAEIVVVGEVSIKKNISVLDNFKITYKFVAKQVNNGRIIGEVKRFYTTDSGDHRSVVYENIIKTSKKVISDLSEQIQDSWQKGIFGSNSMLLVVKGELDYFQVKKFKNQLSRLNSIRLLRDRFYSNELIKFEADINLGVRKFSEVIKKTKFKNFRVSVDDVESQQIVLKVRPI